MSAPFHNLNLASGAAVAAVLNSLWQAAGVAAVAWIAMRLIPRMNAATRHLIWWAVLAVMFLLPVAALLPPRQQARRFAAWVPSPNQVVVVDSGRAMRFLPTPIRNIPAAQREAPVEVRAGWWPTLVLAIWLGAALLQFIRLLWSYCYLRELKLRAQPVSPELRASFDVWMKACRIRRRTSVLVSSDIVSPMAVGFFRPAVLLPASLLDQFRQEELDHVLLHELAHIARQDDWTNLGARVAGVLLALHPVATWVLRQIEREREIACDDWVVSMTGAARPYAACLARLFEICFVRRRLVLATGMTGRSSHLGERIESLMRSTREFAPKVSMGRVVLCTPLLLVLAVAGALAPRWLVFAQATPPPAIHTRPPSMMVRRAAPGGGSFLAALVAAGYGDLSVDDIISVKNAGVSAHFLSGLAESGIEKLSAQQMIALTQHGVSPEYLRKVRDAGIRDLSFQNVLELAGNGVRPEAIQEIHALGFGPYNSKQAIEFSQNGVRPELFRAFRDNGLENATAGEIIEAQRAGIESRNLHEARQYGPNLTIRQIIRLKNAGVI